MEDDDFEHQLRLEKEERERVALEKQRDGEKPEENAGGEVDKSDPYTYTDPNDGTVYEWDHDKRAWFPKINDDFIAMYQANYGYTATESTSEAKSKGEETAEGSTEKGSADPGEDKTGDRREGSSKDPGADADEPEVAGSQILKKKGLKNVQKRPATWFELDDAHNTKVYVSGLPTKDFDEEKFIEMMSKYGMLFKDETGKCRAKLYRDQEGNLKGDGICTYLKVESVDLAVQLLDGSLSDDGKEIHVERAKFQLKGEFDPAKKPKQMKKRDKEKLKKKIDKLFAWKPDKLRGERNKCENTVVLKNFFEPKDFDEDARLILEYQKDLREECETKFGEVKKVVIYDRNPEGIATITFKDVEHADACLATMNGRFFAGRQLQANQWDGKEKFKIVETEEQLEKRMQKWDEYLEKE